MQKLLPCEARRIPGIAWGCQCAIVFCLKGVIAKLSSWVAVYVRVGILLCFGEGLNSEIYN